MSDLHDELRDCYHKIDRLERERDQARAEVERLRKVRDAAQTVLFAKENGHTTVEMFASHSLRSAFDAAKEDL